MSSLSEKIISQIDKGVSVLTIAKMFGGMEEFKKLIKEYPYLNALVMSKLGGTLYCSAENEDGDMIPFSLNFILTDLEAIDVDDLNHYNATVNIIMPEIVK